MSQYSLVVGITGIGSWFGYIPEAMRGDLAMNNIQVFSAIAFALAVGMAYADTPQYEPYTGSTEFEKIKQLAGTWRGRSIMQGKEQDITITFEVTSAGSAVVARHFPGTPNEMVSVYHDKEGKLSMMHYCALKNQPILGLKNATAKSIELEYTGGINIDQDKDAHMRSLTITFVDDKRIIEQWSMYKDGRHLERSPIKLTRVQED